MKKAIKNRKVKTAFCRLLVIALLVYQTSELTFAQTARQLERQTGGASQASEKRVALVVGNGDYQNATKLGNPSNDASDMAKTLRGLGFEVFSGVNQTLPQMRRLVREFGARLKQTGGVGLFYYAGHGVQVGGRNFLIPVDAEITSEIETEDSALDVNAVLRQMDAAGNGFNIVILDACRNNPFARSWNRDVSGAGGLAQISAPSGTLIAYATAPDSVASDGTGRNGLYTSVLLAQMQQPNVDLLRMFQNVRAQVKQKSAGRQVPWESNSTIGDFYFIATEIKAESSESSEAMITARERALERESWLLIQESRREIDFRDFLESFPNGKYAAPAKVKLEQTIWETVKITKDKAKVQAFLNEFPSGANAAAAKLRLLQIERDVNPNGTSILDSLRLDPPANSSNKAERIKIRDALYTDFLKNYKGNDAQRKIAYEAAKEYVQKYGDDTDNTDIVNFLRKWIPRYEVSLSPK